LQYKYIGSQITFHELFLSIPDVLYLGTRT